MFYSIEEITSLIGAHRYGTADAQIGWLLTDSRSLIFPETTLFFAIQTSRNDGHKYIRQLYQRGVRNFVVKSLPENKDLYVGANFLKTMDPLKSLQRLAERHLLQLLFCLTLQFLYLLSFELQGFLLLLHLLLFLLHTLVEVVLRTLDFALTLVELLLALLQALVELLAFLLLLSDHVLVF